MIDRKIIIEVEGGLVQEIHSNDPDIVVDVLDRDNQKCGDCSNEQLDLYDDMERELESWDNAYSI